MTRWTENELDRIGSVEELDFASLRKNGTLRKKVTVWVVRVDDSLYIRAFKGRSGPWFRGVLDRHAGHINAGGVEKDVTFIEELDPSVLDQVDIAYQTKYQHQPKEYVDPMVTQQARSATVKFIPS
jgi:hypothetical protein